MELTREVALVIGLAPVLAVGVAYFAHVLKAGVRRRK